MVLPLDAMLTSTVAPALRAVGFKRKGRRFVITNELGDLAVIEVSTSGKLAMGDGYRHFWVAPWLLPEPFADLWRLRRSPDPVGKEQGLPLWEVPSRPPFRSRLSMDSQGLRLWSFREDDAAQVGECGRAVVDALIPTVVSTLVRLLDRQALIEEVCRADVLPIPGPDTGPINLIYPGGGTTVMPLLADAGDTAGVARLLMAGGDKSLLAVSLQGNIYVRDRIAWAAARLALRGAPNLHDHLV